MWPAQFIFYPLNKFWPTFFLLDKRNSFWPARFFFQFEQNYFLFQQIFAQAEANFAQNRFFLLTTENIPAYLFKLKIFCSI